MALNRLLTAVWVLLALGALASFANSLGPPAGRSGLSG